MTSHDNQLAPQTPQRDWVTVLLKTLVFMTKRTMTGVAMEDIKPAQLDDYDSDSLLEVESE